MICICRAVPSVRNRNSTTTAWRRSNSARDFGGPWGPWGAAMPSEHGTDRHCEGRFRHLALLMAFPLGSGIPGPLGGARSGKPRKPLQDPDKAQTTAATQTTDIRSAYRTGQK